MKLTTNKKASAQPMVTRKWKLSFSTSLARAKIRHFIQQWLPRFLAHMRGSNVSPIQRARIGPDRTGSDRIDKTRTGSDRIDQNLDRTASDWQNPDSIRKTSDRRESLTKIIKWHLIIKVLAQKWNCQVLQLKHSKTQASQGAKAHDTKGMTVCWIAFFFSKWKW